MSPRRRAGSGTHARALRASLAVALGIAALALAACGGNDDSGGSSEAGGPQAALLPYLPPESQLIGSVDLVQARHDLKLPKDADPFAINKGGSLESKLKDPNLQLTFIAADGFSPLAVELINLRPDVVTKALDGSAIQQAASNRLDLKRPVSVIRTTQSFDEIARSLSSDYARNGATLLAKDPKAQVTSIADAGDGIIVFAGGDANAKDLAESPAGGPQALVDLITPADEADAIATAEPPSSCIEAFGGWNAPDGSGTMALSIKGGADESLFHPEGLQGSPVTLGDATVDGDRIEVPMTRSNDSLATSGNILEPTIRGAVPLTGLYDCKG